MQRCDGDEAVRARVSLRGTLVESCEPSRQFVWRRSAMAAHFDMADPQAAGHDFHLATAVAFRDKPHGGGEA